MLDKHSAIKAILEEFPSFEDDLKEHLNNNSMANVTMCYCMIPFITFVFENCIRKQDSEQTKKAMVLIEKCISDGDEDVNYGAELCFLESITNRLLNKNDSKLTRFFVNNLEPYSKQFCIEIDKFSGTQTPGLET